MEDHVPRHAQMGAWVLINDRWYKSVRTSFALVGTLHNALNRRDWANSPLRRRGEFYEKL